MIANVHFKIRCICKVEFCDILSRPVCEVRGWSEETEGRYFLPRLQRRRGYSAEPIPLWSLWSHAADTSSVLAAALEMVALGPNSHCSR